MKIKFYLLLIALVTTIGSVWGQTERIGGVVYEKEGTNAVVRGKVDGDIPADGVVTIVKEVLFAGDTDPSPVVGIRGIVFGRSPLLKELIVLANLEFTTNFSFLECPNLETVRFEGDVAIEEYVFQNCSNLTSVEFLGITSFKQGAFEHTGLTGTFSIPANVEYIGEGAFGGCKIDAFEVDDNNQHYKAIDGVIFSKDGKTLVAYPSGRGGAYTIPSGVETLGAGSFRYTENLTEVIIPEGVTTIERTVFHSCASLASISLPESLRSIEYQAFKAVPITEISIPANVTTIGDRVFEDNINLKTVIFEGETMPEIGSTVFNRCEEIEQIIVPNNSDEYDDLLSDLSALGLPSGVVPVLTPGITVDFDINGGSGDILQKVFRTATAVEEPAEPTRAGFTFDGWYNNGTKWDFTRLIGASMTLVAQWAEVIPPPAPTMYTVTINPIAGVSVNKSTTSVKAGSTFSFTVSAAAGSTVTAYMDGSVFAPASDNFYSLTVSDNVTFTFSLTAGGSGSGTTTDGKVVVDGSESNIGGGFPSTGEIVLTPPAVTPGTTPSVTINGETATGSWKTDENGDPIYVVDYEGLPNGKHDLVVNGEEFEFTTGGSGSGSGSGTGSGTSGGKVVVDGSTTDLPGKFPSGGEIVLTPPAVTPGTTPSVTIDGKEVGGSWTTDEDGKPVYVVDYDGLPNGEHTLVVDGKEIEFTTDNGTGSGSGTTGGKVVVDGSTTDLPGKFPSGGEIVLTPPAVTPGTTPSVTIDGKTVTGSWTTDEDGKPVYVIEYEGLPNGDHTLVVDGKEIEFTTDNGSGSGSGSGSTGGTKVIVDGSDPVIPGEFPSTGGIVIYPPAVDPSNPGTITIDGKEVNVTVITDANGNPIAVEISYDGLTDGTHTLVIDGEEFEFTTGSGSGSTGGGKVIVDGSEPTIPGDFPPTGGIVIYPPAIDPSNPGTVTIDGKEVPVTVITDKNGNPIAVSIDYDGLVDGEHTLVINGKEYNFTTSKNAGATSNTVLSTSATVTASYGTVTIDTPKVSTVYVVSLSGSVVYNAKVVGTVTVNLQAGIYVVVVDGVSQKNVVR